MLQLHLHPTGKPETIRPRIGFYFTDLQPTNSAFRLAIKSFELNIPPGETNYVVEESYRLPVDARILHVETHAHYLAKQMQAWAILPNGDKKSEGAESNRGSTDTPPESVSRYVATIHRLP